MESITQQQAVALAILFFLLFVVLFAVTSYRKLIRMQKERDLALSESRELKSKYGPILDVEAHVTSVLKDARRLRREADIYSQQTVDARESILSEAKEEATQAAIAIIHEAKERKRKADDFATRTEEKRESIVNLAKAQADSLVSSARELAEKIAGDALEAKDKADIYSAALVAMKNQIEGYRDEYIIPNHAAIDDLAEEYGHKEAGQQLKDTRRTIRALVMEHQAATCDYVDPNRKITAEHFVLDAFNGKVESAISRVKHDNYGKLEQEIKDAFALVNKNGLAFRNARIEPVFLKLRLEELRWAVAVQELKLIEREEQRAIREQLREEERARREIEKAIKEAEKEERLLEKALAKARRELASAHESQKAEYEANLVSLQAKLAEAEEKGQRAVSMAEQTRRGHVYVISNIGSFGENIFKIGMTRRLEPLDRVKELGDASVPFSFDIHAMIFSDDAPTLEKELHRYFQKQAVNKVNPRKEFFGVPLSVIRQKIEQLGMNDVHWTMRAEAEEFRESRALSKEKEVSLA